MFRYDDYSVVESLANNPYRKFARIKMKMPKKWYEKKIKYTSNKHEVSVWRSEMNELYPQQK